jgi:hypothetical protein
MRRNKTIIALAAVVLIHAAVTVAHGSAHASAAVGLDPAETAFVLAVIVIGPVAGLIWLRWNARSGAILIASTMMAALLFGLAKHFVMPGADRVDYVRDASRALFEGTAVLLAITESAGVALGVACSRKRRTS